MEIFMARRRTADREAQAPCSEQRVAASYPPWGRSISETPALIARAVASSGTPTEIFMERPFTGEPRATERCSEWLPTAQCSACFHSTETTVLGLWLASFRRRTGTSTARRLPAGGGYVGVLQVGMVRFSASFWVRRSSWRSRSHEPFRSEERQISP